MFDDIKSQANNPQYRDKNPFQGKSGPEDIFAGTDKGAVSSPQPQRAEPESGVSREPPKTSPLKPVTTPVQPATAVAKEKPTPTPETGSKRKYFIIMFVVIFALVCILVGMIIFAYYKSSGDAGIAPDQLEPESAGGELTEPAGDEFSPYEFEPETMEPSFEELMDTDDDGLTDAEEQRLGTDPNSVDSDNDGLFDREEVRVYKTDPTNPDTDGDGYGDGEEVENGFDPVGPGKLYELP